MRVLASTNPLFGHFTPLVPLAQRLQARGHDVVVATEPGFGAVVRSYGLVACGVGRDLTLDDVLGVLPEIFTVTPEGQDAYARPRVFVELRAANLVDDLLEFASTWKPDLILREGAEFAGWAVAERLGIPQVTVNVGMPITAAVWDADAAPWFTALGRRVGVADLHASSLYRDGVISFEPAGYNAWSGVPTARAYRPEAIASPDPLPARVVALDDRHWIYATLGTEFYNVDLMAAIVAGLAAGDWNVLATTGPQGDPAAIATDAAHVVVTQWLPQDAVMDRAAAVVSHAGAAAVAGCLVRGIPTVCVPQGADQFHHARRVEELGAGIVLAVGSRAPDDIRTAVETVLGDPAYRAAAQRIASATAGLPDVDAAAERVERVGTGAHD